MTRRLGRRPASGELQPGPLCHRARRAGRVLFRRARGEYGAIGVLLAVDERARSWIRMQRRREPEPVARYLALPAWAPASRGKRTARGERGDERRAGRKHAPPPQWRMASARC